MKRYGYHRTSTREQHLDRGITEINAYCSANNLELEKIFTDQQTGKNFNRPRYTIMKEDVLRAGDELIITEVDRLGRNKQETLKELQYYRDNGIRVFFASAFWKKLQSIFGECCISKLEKVAKPRLAAILPAT